MENKKLLSWPSEIKLIDNKTDKKLEEIPSSDCAELQKIIENTRCVIDSLEQGIVIYSPDLRYQMLSKNIERIFWLKEEQVVGKTLSEIFYSSEKEPIVKQLEDVLKWEEPYSLEYPLKINGNGPDLFVRKIAKAIFSSKWKIIWILWIVTDITQDKKREKEEIEANFFLRESQEKAGIWSYKADFISRKWKWTEALNKIFGIDEDYEKNIQSWFNLIHPDDLEMMQIYVQDNVISRWEKFDKEYRIIRKEDKEIRWVHWLGQVKFDDNNNAISLIWTIQDITEKKELVEAFSNSNELLTLFLKNSPIFAYIKEIIPTESRAIMISDNFEKMLGIKAVNIIGKKMDEIFTPELAQKITNDDYEVILGNKVVTLEEEFNNRRYLTIKFPIKQSGKTLVAWYAIDITKRKQIEENLRATKDLILSIANGTLDVVFAKDKDWKYTFANKALERFLGKSKDEILWKNLTEILPETEGSSLLEREKEILRTWKCLTYEETIKDSAGKIRNFSIMKWPLYDSKWNLSWLFGISRDITEKKIIEEQLQIRQKMDSLWTLAWWICHDFNNLLAWISGNLQLVEMSKNIPEREMRLINNGILCCDRAAELTKQLQTLSINSITDIKDFDIHWVAKEVFNLLEKLTDKIVKKIIDFNEWDFYVRWSESEIHQVLLNLWTNAFKSIEERECSEGDFIKIKVENYRSIFNDKTNLPEWDYVHILFEDNWIWMSEEIIKKAFDLLFTTRKKSWERWKGLWLSMVYNIVTVKHGGHIYIESEEWIWTIMHVYLPKWTKQEKIIPNKVVDINQGNETILVIDDEEMIRNYLKTVLESSGYNVITAEDGKEWLDTYIKNVDLVDLVVLDLTMPKMSGQTVLENMLEFKDKVKVIISSWQSPEQIREWILSKAKGFVHKPYSLKKLTETVRSVLDEK